MITGLFETHINVSNLERPMVFAWMPALAIYFRDPDGHSLEFISMLPDKPKPELKVVSWESWQELKDK